MSSETLLKPENAKHGRLILLYHFFHPDDVISARLFTELGERAAQDGWDVVAMPSVRSCHDGSARLSHREHYNGIDIQRVWRPAWRQASHRGRLGNTLAILANWSWRALVTARRSKECLVIGTDPPLGVLAAIPWRLFRPRCRIIHWCHDLYPHAAIAEGLLRPQQLLVRVLNTVLRFAYRRCDHIVDLGPCMRRHLAGAVGGAEADPQAQSLCCRPMATLTPWSLVEPDTIPDSQPEVREELFGSAQIGLLYSGNLGRAHLYQPFLDLARELRDCSIGFCYAGRGPRMDELKGRIEGEDTNVSFAGFATECQLTARLAAADIHLVSLQNSWTGTVVPSKFFGALAVGRPVLYAGSRESAIAGWIEKFKVGWVLDEAHGNNQTVSDLRAIAADRSQLIKLQRHCFNVYRAEFSRSVQLSRWSELLRECR
jgi:colanic acid biosynthesis glycosyl transferase WcaI